MPRVPRPFCCAQGAKIILLCLGCQECFAVPWVPRSFCCAQDAKNGLLCPGCQDNFVVSMVPRLFCCAQGAKNGLLCPGCQDHFAMPKVPVMLCHSFINVKNLNVNWYFLIQPSGKSHAIDLILFLCHYRGVASGGRGANCPERRVGGAPMMPTSSTKLLFYRIISVYFSKKSLLNWRFGTPHWQKPDMIFQKYGNVGSPLLKIAQLKI